MTRVVVLLIFVASFAALAALLWFLANRFERAGDRVSVPPWRWRAASQPEPSGTRVVIERVGAGSSPGSGEVLETREIGVAAATDPEQVARLADLVLLAEDRARLLNQQAEHS